MIDTVLKYFSNFGIDNNTAGTLIVTLLVFFLGYIFNGLFFWIRGQFQKRSYRKAHILILKDFSKNCLRQYQKVSESINGSSLEKGDDLVVKTIPVGALDYLASLNYREFIQKFEPAFSRSIYYKAISKLFEHIRSVAGQTSTFREYLIWFNEYYKGHENDFYANVHEIRKLHDDLHGSRLNAATEFHLARSINKIFDEYVRMGNKTDPSSVYHQIVNRIITLGQTPHTFTPLKLMMNHALLADVAYLNIVKSENMLRDRIGIFAAEHKRASRIIAVVIKILN